MSKQTIVLARLVEDVRVKRPGRPDIGRLPSTETYLRSESVIWLNEGSESDLENAEKCCQTHMKGWKVFSYPTSEKHPRARAEKDIFLR